MEKSADIIQETLITRCLDAYWDPSFAVYGISSNTRMAKVLQVIASEIRSWAPEESQTRMNAQTIIEVANRIIEMADAPAP